MKLRICLITVLCLGLSLAGCARLDPRPVNQAVDDTVKGR